MQKLFFLSRVELKEFVDCLHSLESSAMDWFRAMGLAMEVPLGEGLGVSMEGEQSIAVREEARSPAWLCGILHQAGSGELSPELTIQVCQPSLSGVVSFLMQLYLSTRSRESHQLAQCKGK